MLFSLLTPFLLGLIGLILLFIEFYLPGIVIGLVGGCFIFAGILLAVELFYSPWLVLLYVLGNALGIFLVIKLALWRIRYAKAPYALSSNQDQQGYVASSYDKTAIGQVAIVSSDLKPGGYITLAGKQHQALSQAGYISRGEEVLIIAGQEESLIVKQIKKDPTL